MKVTQKVIDIARAKLPNPLGLTFGTFRHFDVSSIEAGISSEDDECAAVVTVSFKLGRKGWEHYDMKALSEAYAESTINDKPALKVVELKPHTKEPGDNVVQRLEQALELARRGELSNVVVVAVLNNGDVMDCWANGSQPYAVVGGLEGLKFEFINACIEKREEQ